MNDKKNLIDFMNSLDFQIADIKYENGTEWYAHKMQDSDEIVWFHISSGGSGFIDLFEGSIKEVCEHDKQYNLAKEIMEKNKNVLKKLAE